MQKGWILCQEVMVQVLEAKGPVRDVVWAEAKVKARVEAEWAGRLQQDWAEVVSVRNAGQRLDMLPDSLVMR